MATTTSRSARYAKWLSIPVGLVISALLIWQASHAAFSHRVASPDNTWATGSVTLELDHADGEPLFTVPNLAPGDDGTEEVTVSYTGSLDAVVSFYGTSDTTSALSDHINLLVEGAAGDTFASPTGKIFEGSLTQFVTQNPNFDEGIQYHNTADAPTKTGTFKFTYSFPEDAHNDLQAQTAKIDFFVEARHVPKEG